MARNVVVVLRLSLSGVCAFEFILSTVTFWYVALLCMMCGSRTNARERIHGFE